MQSEEGRWRVEFDEPWAQEGAKPPEEEAPTADAPDQSGDRAAA
jgi:DNA topoisomerase-3